MKCNRTAPSPPCQGGDSLNTLPLTEGSQTFSQQFSVKRDSLWIEGFYGRGKIYFAKFGD